MRLQTQYLLIASAVLGATRRVGKLPALGYNTWNLFGCDLNSTTLLAQAEAIKKYGLLEAGYDTFMLDDCYSLKNRSESGEIVADPAKFPRGLKDFTQSLDKLGFKAGIYSDAGYRTCGGFPGSYGNEELDVKTFSDWGFSYLKYDNCYIPFDHVTQENVYGRYQRMAQAIETAAKLTDSTPMRLALCEWGWQEPWLWGAQLGQSWRVGGDIKPWWSAVASILNMASFIAAQADFYGHNDFDMLEVGNNGIGVPPGNLTYEEAKSHFTAWALLKSPLLIGTDVANATEQTISILGNKDILKIHQDPHVGRGITPFRWGNNADWTFDSARPASYWSGNSSYGIVFMVLNTEETQQAMSFNLTESWAVRAGRVYSVYDMWSHTHNGTAVRNITVVLPPHGVAALLLNDIGPEPEGLEPYCAGYWQCSFPNGTYYSN